MTKLLYLQPIFHESARRFVGSVSRDLRQHGYDVRHVETVEEALRLPSDVILAGVIYDGDCPEIRQHGSRSAANLTAYERLKTTGKRVVVATFDERENAIYRMKGFSAVDCNDPQQVFSRLRAN